jgi:hypothetical protein
MKNISIIPFNIEYYRSHFGSMTNRTAAIHLLSICNIQNDYTKMYNKYQEALYKERCIHQIKYTDSSNNREKIDKLTKDIRNDIDELSVKISSNKYWNTMIHKIVNMAEFFNYNKLSISESVSVKKYSSDIIYLCPEENSEYYNIEICPYCCKSTFLIIDTNDWKWKCIECLTDKTLVIDYTKLLKTKINLSEYKLKVANYKCIVFKCKRRPREAIYNSDKGINLYCRKCLELFIDLKKFKG